MYDLYPETWQHAGAHAGTHAGAHDWQHDGWGPARHRPDSPHSAENVRRELQAAFDRRDARGPRPDDN